MPVRITKVVTVWAVDIGHGAGVAHWLGALSPTPWMGTEMPMSGIAKVCDASSGLIPLTAFPLRVICSPWTPRGFAQRGFRRPLFPSKL